MAEQATASTPSRVQFAEGPSLATVVTDKEPAHHVKFAVPEAVEASAVNAGSQRRGAHSKEDVEMATAKGTEEDVDMQSESDSEEEAEASPGGVAWSMELDLPDLEEVKAGETAAAIDFGELREILHKLNFSECVPLVPWVCYFPQWHHSASR